MGFLEIHRKGSHVKTEHPNFSVVRMHEAIFAWFELKEYRSGVQIRLMPDHFLARIVGN
jgi:hypothetical protein